MSRIGISAALLTGAAMLGSSPAYAQEAAGHVLWMSGQVERLTPDGIGRPLAKGDAVLQGDVLRTGPNSHAQLLMTDQGLIAVRPDSSMRVTAYAYQGREDGTERAVFELLRGGLRSITGAIGRANKDNYQLKGGPALVGIRGTDHETFVVETPASGGSTAEFGTYNRVTLGGTYLQSPQGRVDLDPGQTGFAGSMTGSAPLRLERAPEFMHLAALQTGTVSGLRMRENAPGDQVRLRANRAADEVNLGKQGLLEKSAEPLLPAQALGENAPKDKHLWGKGGRCEGLCADLIKGKKGAL